VGFGPQLEGENVVLRPPVLADRESRQALGRHEEIQIRLGYGLGTQTTRLVVDYAFRSLGLERIHLDVLAFNQRAINCYLKAGFHVVGRKPSNVIDKGAFVEDVVMEISAAK
jgi:RimJ/RimL family protein N-acetyltransferase